MDRLARISLLSGSLFYFIVCILAGFEINYVMHKTMIIFFTIIGLIVTVRYVVLLIAAIREKSTENVQPTSKWTPSISIIVPAYNEEELIEDALTSLAEQDYPDFEIIVVDDGSTDGTACIARKVLSKYPAIHSTIISQSNAGKSWALNTGIVHAQGEFIFCVDSDSKLEPNALMLGIRHFEDKQVGAVGGFVDIINTNKMIARMQQLEYVIGLNFLRRGLSLFNIVTVVPGPVGMFRMEAVKQVGGYNTLRDCFAEDADLTVRLLVNGWRVQGETRMIAHTEAPDTIYTLLRQRYRWKRGIFQACFDNYYRLITSKNIKYVFVAAILAFESFLFDVINFGITLFALSSFLAFGELKIFILAFIVISSLDLTVFFFSNMKEPRIGYRFILFLLQKISYAYVLQVWGVLSMVDEWLSVKMKWDKLDRIGSVPFPGES